MGLPWTGTAIYLYGAADGVSFSTNLDGVEKNHTGGTSSLLFAETGLTYGPHALILEKITGLLSISSAILTVGVGEPG
jgi:hypothetical protein